MSKYQKAVANKIEHLRSIDAGNQAILVAIREAAEIQINEYRCGAESFGETAIRLLALAGFLRIPESNEPNYDFAISTRDSVMFELLRSLVHCGESLVMPEARYCDYCNDPAIGQFEDSPGCPNVWMCDEHSFLYADERKVV